MDLSFSWFLDCDLFNIPGALLDDPKNQEEMI
jgi:hypothetical protein